MMPYPSPECPTLLDGHTLMAAMIVGMDEGILHSMFVNGGASQCGAQSNPLNLILILILKIIFIPSLVTYNELMLS